MSKQKEREDRLSTKGATYLGNQLFRTLTNLSYLLYITSLSLHSPTGIRKTRDAQLRPESPDRGVEARTTAAHPHA